MVSSILQAWLHLFHHMVRRLILVFPVVLQQDKGRLILASAVAGFLVSLIVRTQAFDPAQTPTDEQTEAMRQINGVFNIEDWGARGMAIRSGGNLTQCWLNLAKALEEVGDISASEYNGAAGALSLLPTAGALLGAPTREMWIVYKLVPVAGVLCMFLSLGATITPSDVGEYESGKAFSYGGLMPTVRTETAPEQNIYDSDAEDFEQLSEAKKFAMEVQERAKDDSGGDVHMKVWVGIGFQCAFIVIILVAMWYAQRGAVIPWWCRVWGWMFFWYALVIATSVFDNIVAAPFTSSWTIRVAKAPTRIMVDQTQSHITQFDHTRWPTIIDRLKAGVNIKHRVTIADTDPSIYSRTCFYVVISVQGISSFHAFLQVISRLCSVAVFAFGTALFASATLMSITAALMLLCLVLPMGMMGRVVAMWIAAEMNKHNKSILHTVVKSKKEAGEHIEAILDLSGLQIETMGHIILDGNCITKRSPLFSAATYIGLLAKPYDLVRVAVRNQRVDSFSRPLISMKERRPSVVMRKNVASTVGTLGITQTRATSQAPVPSQKLTTSQTQTISPSQVAAQSQVISRNTPIAHQSRDSSRNHMFGPV